MSRERFIALVKNPALVRAEDAPFLEELLKEFPYFQTAHLLAARCYKVNDSIHLQKQIKIAAAHITDRKVLYNLLENSQPATSVEVPEYIAHKVSATINQTTADLVDDAQTSEKHTVQVEIEPSITQDGVSTEATPEAQENTLVEVPLPAVAEVDEKVEPIANIAQENEELNDVMLEKSTEEIQISIIKAEIPLENEIKLALAETIYLKEFEEKALEIPEIAPENEVISPKSDELSPLSVEKQEKQEEINAHAPNKEIQTAFVAWLKNLQSATKHQEKSSSSVPVKEEEKLIEAFIDKPIQRAKPQKQEFFSPVNMAKQSVTDNDFFVTETLAKIYIKQGNLTKAIKVYQNLSLKNPEKNTFFAAQIKILKEQLHNKSGK